MLTYAYILIWEVLFYGKLEYKINWDNNVLTQWNKVPTDCVNATSGNMIPTHIDSGLTRERKQMNDKPVLVELPSLSFP